MTDPNYCSYAAVSTVKRLLDHLKEAAFFSAKDLESIEHRLRDYRESVQRGSDNYDTHLLTLLDARIKVCENILADLKQFLSQLPQDLAPTYEKLVSILRSLSSCNVKSTYPTWEVAGFKQQLKEIQDDLAKRGGCFSTEDHSSSDLDSLITRLRSATTIDNNAPPSGEKLVRDLLWRNLVWADIMEEKQGRIDERFEELYVKLLSIRNKLEKLYLTHAWSLRETELYNYQRQLDRIDEARVDGNFVDNQGNQADIYAQRVSQVQLTSYHGI
jgi:hypothetical protein